MKFIASRHSATIRWLLKKMGSDLQLAAHITPSCMNMFVEGDIVYGNLPIRIVAELCKRGVHYFDISLNVPQKKRGTEFTSEDLEKFGISLQEYFVKEVK